MELSERQRAILWTALHHYRATVNHTTAGGHDMDNFLRECDQIIVLLKESLHAGKAWEKSSDISLTEKA
tara:strand:- start:16427 stop:16633 length:207 start_codon:yes stop_codon:yes gene_type:complete